MVRDDSRTAERIEVLLVACRSESAFLQTLAQLGAVLTSVASAADAVSLCQQRPYPIVMVLGDSAETLEAVKILKDLAPAVLVITPANAAKSFTAKAYEAGAVDVLVEPVPEMVLNARLGAARRLLRIRDGAGPRAIESRPRAATRTDLPHLQHEFLAMLGHELRNPLAPLGNAVQILRQAGTKGALADQTLDLIERQLRHLTRLVNDLLDVSRVTRGKIVLKKEPLDLNQAAAHAAELARLLFAERDLHLTVDRAGAPLRILADPARLEQILENLLMNAVRYTEPGGRVWIRLESEDGLAILRIGDTGIGIRPELQSRIFDLFAQGDRAPDRPQEGLGIGLTLVHRLVELHGGTIEVASAGLGQGSEFTLRFPLLVEAMPELPRETTHYVAPNGRLLRILVVEDNKDSAKSLAGVLRLWGHEVQIAYDGPSALEVAESFHPEVVFLDIGLPKSMDGYEVALRLREQPDLEKARIVALTGFGQPEDRRRAMQAGFDQHLTKPVLAEDLRALLADVCATRTQSAPHQ